MSAKSRRIGATCERSVVHLAESLGLTGVRVIRTATSRDDDPGDVHIGRHIVCQVKGGQAAKDAGWKQRRRWYDEARQQADTVQELDGRMRIPLLAVQRTGTPQHRADDWIGVLWLPDLMWMHDPFRHNDSDLPDVITETRLRDVLELLA